MQDEISLNASFQWKLGVCVYCSSCSSLIKPRTWLFMFLKPSKPINHQVIKTVKPKPYESNPCERKKNQTHVKKNQTHQTQRLIKRSNPANATDQTDLPKNRSKIKPSKRNRSNPANPLPINPSTTTEFRSTHQTPHRSTHPPPPSSDQPIKPLTDQPIHHHQVPKSNPLPINPSNPPSINPSTTTEFLNQETKTLVLHKTKVHGRKREEAPPRA